MMEPTTLAYLASMVDGDGHTTINRNAPGHPNARGQGSAAPIGPVSQNSKEKARN